ncbi:LysR family transcriptional regulator [Actinomadura sp. HBU206391]|uniref:LysR family transcriptional regulator n=1 Tax=Actinomadura sp. HBU206391 TaxID=2731692 RepID=UPI001650B65C|nr:LysR family transcriptional regulator [Actinomadura sp. HBU206391]MBC6457287.1 LysR family transcriptional regulator [Actinomadura sp. HBU206391]
MDFTAVSLTGLRVVREIAERGTFSAAADSLDYTQSAVSRQVAAVERAAGTPVFERRRDGVRPTAAGRVILRHAAAVLDEIDAADRELRGLPAETGTVRLGAFPTAGAVLLPQALTLLRRTHPGISVVTRDGGTPSLVRGLRAGSLDLAILGSAPPFRAPDSEEPALTIETLAERNLCVAVPATHPLAAGDWVDVGDLQGQRWIAGRSSSDEPQLGAWPGLAGRPDIVHTSRDWLTKLRLVAAGCGLTTVPAVLAAAVPPGVRVLAVRGGPEERRRVIVAHLPHRLPEATARVIEALRAVAGTQAS